MPWATPAEMFTFLGASAFTLGALLLPENRPPITPPELPPRPSMPATPKLLEGGASFSATFLMSLGILVGATSWLFIISDCTCTTCTGAAGGGGGGGGGGG